MGRGVPYDKQKNPMSFLKKLRGKGASLIIKTTYFWKETGKINND